MAGGFGAGGWGSSPWGGSASVVVPTPPPTAFDIYCFYDPIMTTPPPGIIGDPAVTLVQTGTQFSYTPVVGRENDLFAESSSATSTDNAILYLDSTVPATWSFDFIVYFDSLPNDFNNLVNNHAFFGVTNATGLCAGLFLSKIGLMYAGAVSHSGGNLQVESATQQLPDSVNLVSEGEYWNYRIVADVTTNAVYVYATRASDVPIIGHQLKYVLPGIDATDLAISVADRTTVSLRGTVSNGTKWSLDQLCLGTGLIMPNLRPIADAGADQAARLCSVVRLDGSESFDPEGVDLQYWWRLTDAPQDSSFSIEGNDGKVLPLSPATGFTNKFHTPLNGTLAALDTAGDPVVTGDVLTVAGESYTVFATGTDGDGYYLLFTTQIIPDDLGTTDVPYKVMRQRGLNGIYTVDPTFFPDKLGFYSFDLIVNDGELTSAVSTTIVNILESPLPRGCTPSLEFTYNFLSDFWQMVEDAEVIPVFWGALAQVAATELFTLWQLEYNKSLRDAQRTFTRRWIHYDLLLPEPLPELTVVRALWGGITSEAIPAAGLVITSGHLDISIPSRSTYEIVITSPGTLTGPELAAQLRSRLAEVDERFTVVEYQHRTTNDWYIRIDAPFPFSIEDTSTTPATFFVVDQTNTHPNGTGGVVVGSNSYKLPISLTGVDIELDDYLVLDGVAYRILRVVDLATDEFPYQRVIVRETLPTPGSSAWDISGWVSSEYLNFWGGLVSADDPVFFEVGDNVGEASSTNAEYDILEARALGACEAAPSKLALDAAEIADALSRPEEVSVRLAKVVRRSYLPIDSLVVDVPYLSEKIVIETTEDEEAVIRRNVDYFIEEYRGHNSLHFVADIHGGNDIWEGQTPPPRLWAEYTYIDNRPLLEGTFGIPAEFTLDQLNSLEIELDYLSALRGLWYAYFNGPTVRNLRIGTQILLGLPFAEQAGTIEEIRTDFSPNNGRILVRDSNNDLIVRSYSYPNVLELEINPLTNKRYAVGDTVAQFDPLVEGAEAVDYIKDPDWFEGLLNQGVFVEVEKFFTFLIRVNSAAFSVSSLTFVRNFILNIKPTYTFPKFVVELLVEAGTGFTTEVSVTDNVVMIGYHQPVEDIGQTAESRWSACTRFHTGGPIQTDHCFYLGSTGAPRPISVVYHYADTYVSDVVIPTSPSSLSLPHLATDPTDIVRISGEIDYAEIQATPTVATTDKKSAAIGTITTVAGANLIDGETITISDGISPAITFEFDDDSSVSATSTLLPLPFTASDTASDVRDSIIAAINAVYPPLTTASIGGASQVDLIQDIAGEQGNITITHTVADVGFSVSGMSGADNYDDLELIITVNGSPNVFAFSLGDANAPCMSVELTLSPPVSVSATAATGTVTLVAESLLVDGETFTIDDGINGQFVFEFDKDGSHTTGNWPIPLAGGETDTQVRDLVITAINNAAGCHITASTGAFPQVANLTNDYGGADGNTTSSNTVGAVGFLLTNMSGGTGDTIAVAIRSPGSSKTFEWRTIRVQLFQKDEITSWSYDMGLPTGTYCVAQA